MPSSSDVVPYSWSVESSGDGWLCARAEWIVAERDGMHLRSQRVVHCRSRGEALVALAVALSKAV